MRDKFTRFMMGRYGIDTLGKVNIGVVLVLLIVNMFLNSPWLYWLSLILLVVAYCVCFQEMYKRRYRENQWFADRFSGIAGWFRRRKIIRRSVKNIIFIHVRHVNKSACTKGKRKNQHPLSEMRQ